MSKTNICSIITNEADNLVLAVDFIESTFIKDRYLADNFNQILKYLKRLSIKDKKIVNKDGSATSLPIEVSLKSRVGALQRSEIVKVLTQHSYSYEIRVDETFKHHRIVFFLYDQVYNSFAMTFGFTKIDNNDDTDYTDECALETDRIAIDITINDNKEYWLGADLNGYSAI